MSDYSFLSQSDWKGDIVVVNENGGKQSKIVEGWTNLPFEALEKVAGQLHTGEQKYGRLNWQAISKREHIEHAYRHIARYATLGEEEDLICAACRILFALAD